LILVTMVLKVVVMLILQQALVTSAGFDLEMIDLRLYTGINAVVTLIFDLFGAVVVAVTYHDLRLEKDGVSVDELAAVFD
jgi:hypothetical protein